MNELRMADVPSYPLGTIAEMWNERVQLSPDSLFAQFMDGAALPGTEGYAGQSIITTYADVDRLAKSVRAELARSGAAPDARVLLHMGNGLPFVVGFIGATLTGATVVPTIVQATSQELEYTIRDSECGVVVVEEEYLAKAEEICRRLDLPLLLVGGDGQTTWVRRPDSDDLAIDSTGAPVSARAVHPDDVAVIMYTSGTTSQPKGAMLTHRGLLFQAEMNAQHFRLTKHDRMLCVLPLFHINALGFHFLPTIVTGSELVVLKRFSVRAYWLIAKAFRVTVGNLTAETLRLLLRQEPSATDRDHCMDRMLFGMPLSRDEVQSIQGRFGVMLSHHWGLTESTGCATRSSFYRGEMPAESGIGQVAPGNRLRVIGEDGDPVGPNQTGELQIAGIGVFRGYWNRPEETMAAFDGEWLRTGDLGSIDARGNVRLQGRLKDMIKVKGENVAAAEVERVISEIPWVMSVAVVGRRHDVFGEVPVAYVVRAEDCERGVEDILVHCREQLSSFKVPHDVHLISEMPMTSVGKIRKADLWKRAAVDSR